MVSAAAIYTDQATVDRWLAAGTWVQFAEGEAVGTYQRFGEPEQDLVVTWPADWEADQKCETCWLPPGGKPNSTAQEYLTARCPDCNGTGLRRHPVTVPCEHPADHGDVPDRRRCLTHGCSGRITVARATVEWGPAIVVRDMEDVGSAYWGPACVEVNPKNGWARRWSTWDGALDYDEGEDITLPPDIDPATLVGQWARGGKIGGVL